jgi:hypothetical protein
MPVWKVGAGTGLPSLRPVRTMPAPMPAQRGDDRGSTRRLARAPGCTGWLRFGTRTRPGPVGLVPSADSRPCRSLASSGRTSGRATADPGRVRSRATRIPIRRGSHEPPPSSPDDRSGPPAAGGVRVDDESLGPSLGAGPSEPGRGSDARCLPSRAPREAGHGGGCPKPGVGNDERSDPRPGGRHGLRFHRPEVPCAVRRRRE